MELRAFQRKLRPDATKPRGDGGASEKTLRHRKSLSIFLCAYRYRIEICWTKLPRAWGAEYMTDFRHYFPERFAGDQLDVVHLLHAGLARVGARCLLAYEGRRIDVADLSDRVVEFQTELRRMGLRPGERVAVMLPNSVDHIALIYALILLGAVWVPVNVRLQGAGLSYVVDHARPTLMVIGPEFEEAARDLTCVRKISPEALAGSGSAPDASLTRAPGISPSDALCIIYTSGTTGAPKGVVFTHRMLRVASEAALMVADIHPGDRIFLWEPLCHIGGAQMLMSPFLVDVELQVVERFSASRFWEQWKAAKATHLHYLGGVLDVLMQLPEADTPPPPSIRVAWGAGVSAQAWGPIVERFGCELRECYGMTECSSFSTLNTSGTPGSIGVPLPWIGLELLDESDRPVQGGAVGEIVLSSDVDGVFLPEYFGNPEATREALRGGRFHTGDMARQMENGEYVFVGRRTDSMRVRGENVSAWEVERVFADHPAIEAAAAIGVPADFGEQDLALYVQFEAGAAVRWSDLVSWARPRLAAFQLPRYYAAVEKFELTPSQRVRKHRLPKTVSDAWDRTARQGALP